jgi:hypothetical protein
MSAHRCCIIPKGHDPVHALHALPSYRTIWLWSPVISSTIWELPTNQNDKCKKAKLVTCEEWELYPVLCSRYSVVDTVSVSYIHIKSRALGQIWLIPYMATRTGQLLGGGDDPNLFTCFTYLWWTPIAITNLATVVSCVCTVYYVLCMYCVCTIGICYVVNKIVLPSKLIVKLLK